MSVCFAFSPAGNGNELLLHDSIASTGVVSAVGFGHSNRYVVVSDCCLICISLMKHEMECFSYKLSIKIFLKIYLLERQS